MEPSHDQQVAITGIISALRNGHKQVTLRGHAGTGKTTVVRSLIEQAIEAGMTRNITVLAPTGKAASVLSSKLGSSGYNAQTIHRFAYAFKSSRWDEQRETMIPSFNTKWFSSGLIFVDEASMVGMETYQHLIGPGIPIVWVGDHGQLPPVKSQDPGIISDPQHPCFTLETIHRQAEGNGILTQAMHVRTGGRLTDDLQLDDVLQYRPKSLSEMIDHAYSTGVDTILAYQNQFRKDINARAMEYFKLAGPADTCKMICLRNNYGYDLFNGEVWTITGKVRTNTKANCFVANLTNDLGQTRNSVIMTNDPKYDGRDKAIVDYGYCLTFHKSQGSEWGHVAVLDLGINGDYAKAAYTGATRAKKLLTVYKVQ